MPPRSESVITKAAYPVGWCAVGIAAGVIHNFTNRRPYFSGIQKHILLGIGGALLGWQIDEKEKRTFAKRDAILRHYIELHPEDFLPEEKKKYKDLFLHWIPVR